MNGSCVIAALSQRISQSGQDARMGGTDPVALFLCFRSEWPHSSSSSELEVKPRRKATMKTEDDPLLSIGDVAQRSGVKASALRFYESLNLIESVRSASGHRRYHRSSLRRIAFVVFAQRIGFTLEEIAEQLAKLPSRHVPTGGDWQKMSRVWKQRLDDRIGELQRLSESLDQCIGCGCLSLRHCVLHNPGDLCAQNGPGPRRWLGDPPPVAMGGPCPGHCHDEG